MSLALVSNSILLAKDALLTFCVGKSPEMRTLKATSTHTHTQTSPRTFRAVPARTRECSIAQTGTRALQTLDAAVGSPTVDAGAYAEHATADVAVEEARTITDAGVYAY